MSGMYVCFNVTMEVYKSAIQALRVK